MTTELVRAVDQRRCALYRHFDENDILLYVGITDTLADRTNNGHARTSEWVQFAVRAEAEWLDSRAEASVAERAAVKGEEPIFNRQYAEVNVELRISEYLRNREFAAFQHLVVAYEVAVREFLKALPQQELEEAKTRARHDYHCAGHALDRAFPARVLHHLTRISRERTTDLKDEAQAEAYKAVIEFAGQQLEAIRDRRQASAEPPF